MSIVVKTLGQVLLIVCVLAFVTPVKAVDFAQCYQDAQAALNNGSLNTTDLYDGPIRGLKGPRPLTLTQAGCKKLCGSGAQLNGFNDAVQILANWGLPSIALFNQLPFEALGFGNLANIEALINWVGSPAATFSTTVFNIHMIHQCRRLSTVPLSSEMQMVVRDTLYILSCVNQYEYRRRGPEDTRRDTALLRGVLFPFMTVRKNARTDKNKYLTRKVQKRLTGLAHHLAFQLRLQRRRGVWPLAFSTLWFFLALTFSFVVAFDTELGDDSTAHSLALGLLLMWAPALVMAAYVDRNPVSTARCATLIERWLERVDSLFPKGAADGVSDDITIFDIGRYVGQGRKVRYCAVTSTVLSCIQNPTDPHLELPSEEDAANFKRALTRRPRSWYIFWFLSLVIVSVSFATAFAESFDTPTVGLGCRSLAYVCWYLLSLISWFLLGFFQEPPVSVRAMSLIANMLATVALITIMLLQVTNGLNNCFCKSTAFERGLHNGYMDFGTRQFYALAYDLQKTWKWATGCGLTACAATLTWLGWRYESDKFLWRVDERASMGLIDGVDMAWLT